MIDRIASRLNANGMDSAFVEIRDGAVDHAYFERLLTQTHVVIGRARARGEISLSAFLVSGIADDVQLEIERNSFFPALRRVAVNPAWRNNPAAAPRIADAATEFFQDQRSREFVRSVSARRDPRLLLPVRNSRCKSLAEQFVALYALDADRLGGRVERDVVQLRKRKSFRIFGVDFTPAENSRKHPVRRCSPTAKCDLEASFRFGAAVAERFEFDITSETGLRNKTFYQCDETPAAFNGEPTHINMRINGDFEFA